MRHVLAGVKKQRTLTNLPMPPFAAWQDVCAAMSPIIGLRGVAALYHRSLSLSVAAYPWLANVSAPEPPPPCDFTSLRRELSQRTKAEAIAAHNALLHALAQLLTNLIGAELTDRLLHAVWDKHGPIGQDTSS